MTYSAWVMGLPITTAIWVEVPPPPIALGVTVNVPAAIIVTVDVAPAGSTPALRLEAVTTPRNEVKVQPSPEPAVLSMMTVSPTFPVMVVAVTPAARSQSTEMN
jgi:uncharacterized protein (DUF58 family)